MKKSITIQFTLQCKRQTAPTFNQQKMRETMKITEITRRLSHDDKRTAATAVVRTHRRVPGQRPNPESLVCVQWL